MIKDKITQNIKRESFLLLDNNKQYISKYKSSYVIANDEMRNVHLSIHSDKLDSANCTTKS